MGTGPLMVDHADQTVTNLRNPRPARIPHRLEQPLNATMAHIASASIAGVPARITAVSESGWLIEVAASCLGRGYDIDVTFQRDNDKYRKSCAYTKEVFLISTKQ